MSDTARLSIGPCPGDFGWYFYEVRCRHGYVYTFLLDDERHAIPEGQRYALRKLKMAWETGTFCCSFPDPEGMQL